MRSSALALPAAILVVLGLAGCAPAVVAGPQVSEEREIGAATRLVLDSAADMEISIGEPRLVIHGSQGAIDRTRTQVSGDTLTVDSTPGPTIDLGDLRIELWLPEVAGIELNGAGDIEAKGLEIDLLELSIDGSGDIDVAGTADRLVIALSGSGDIDAEELDAAEADVDLSGAGEVELSARDRLSVDLSGAGDVRYHGDPQTTIDVSGVGEVSRA